MTTSDAAILTPELPDMLTAEEAAELLRVNIKTVYAAIHAKQLPAQKVGRSFRISRDALVARFR